MVKAFNFPDIPRFRLCRFNNSAVMPRKRHKIGLRSPYFALYHLRLKRMEKKFVCKCVTCAKVNNRFCGTEIRIFRGRSRKSNTTTWHQHTKKCFLFTSLTLKTLHRDRQSDRHTGHCVFLRGYSTVTMGHDSSMT